jgi:2-oxoglutarate ferredoxin oxidoreductase subunit alpha
MYGRHGESPLPIVAARSPAHCFDAAIEAARIAVTYRTPVILLSDGYIANSSEPWLLPDVTTLPKIDADFATTPNHVYEDGTEGHWPYVRDPETLARQWALPGTPGLMHRIGGIEKENGSGNISYDPANHEAMVRIRAAKVAAVAKSIPPAEVEGDADADLLVVGWGSTWGAIGAAVASAREEGKKVGRVHLMHLNPFPSNLGDLLGHAKRIVVPEMNTGQLTRLLRAEFLAPAEVLSKVQGQPFTAAEIKKCIDEVLEEMK